MSTVHRNMSFSRWLDAIAPGKTKEANAAAEEWLANSSDWREFEKAVCDAIGPDLWVGWKAYLRIMGKTHE